MSENINVEEHDVFECTTCTECTCKIKTTTNAENPQWVLGVEYTSDNIDEKDKS